MGKLEDMYAGDLADITKVEKRTIVRNKKHGKLRFVVLRANFSWTAYVGIPEDHELAGKNYDDIDVNCHGGLTYSGKGGDGFLPKGYYWYGWDYAHLGDYCWYESDGYEPRFIDRTRDHKWTIEEVEKDSWSAIYEFRKLMRLAENIHGKS